MPTFNLDFYANKFGLQKSEFWPRLGSVWPCIDQSQCWSNLHWNPRSKQKISFAEISHVWKKKSLQGDQTNQMMRENVWWCDGWKWPPMLTYIYPSVRVCDTFAGASSLHFILGWPAHVLKKLKINILLIGSRWYLYRYFTSPKEESNKNIGIFIWASQHGVWT